VYQFGWRAVTLWVFLGQVLSADHSCRAAVARLIAHRLARGQSPCSAETGAYCQARKRLPEKFFSAVACLVGRALDAKAEHRWLWKGRRVYMFDGTTVTMPDTPENQEAYPQVNNQKPGLGFPIARIGAITSLWCGAIVNLGFCRYAGKGQGEVSLLRRLWDVLLPGDVLLADSLISNFTNIFLLQSQGVELVSRLNKAHRKADFRRGKRLGDDDHIIRWFKPTSIRSLDWKSYKALPEYITVREARIRVTQPGFRTRSFVVVTTLMDAQQTTKEELAMLYRARWSNELDLRSIKSTMQMRELRCKTPELVLRAIREADRRALAKRTDQGSLPGRHCLPRSVPWEHVRHRGGLAARGVTASAAAATRQLRFDSPVQTMFPRSPPLTRALQVPDRRGRLRAGPGSSTHTTPAAACGCCRRGRTAAA
jgi:Transposase DDE domain